MEKNSSHDLKSATLVETANRAIKQALLHHKAIGNEIVFWRDGKMIREKLSMNASSDTTDKVIEDK